MNYLSFNDAMRARFGTKVYRLSLQSGCTCPNRDGTIGTGGCTFCSEGGSGDFAAPLLPIGEQIEEARKRVDAKISASIAPQDRRYIAYFHPKLCSTRRLSRSIWAPARTVCRRK